MMTEVKKMSSFGTYLLAGIGLAAAIALICTGCAKNNASHPADSSSTEQQSAVSASAASASVSDTAPDQATAPNQATATEQAPAPQQASAPDGGTEKSAPSKPAKPSDPTPAPSTDPAEPPPAPPVDEPPKPGGTSDYSDYNAPTTVESKEITSFSCTASLLNLDLRESSVLIPPRYEFSAVREGEQVKCACSRIGEERTFTAGTAFLEQLQTVVERYDFAAQNGKDSYTHGLPEDFGTTLKVEYASGEAIRASNNQRSLLSAEAIEDLARLFFGAPEGRTYVSISQEMARELMGRVPGALIVDVRRTDEFVSGHISNALCVPNEDIQEGKLDLLPDKDRLLLLYCRSGRRSKEAAGVLAKAGYINVYEFGGIVDWTGEVVTEAQED